MATISISSPSIAEGRPGTSGTLRCAVSLSAPAAQRVTVDYTTTDAAKAKALAAAGTDYTTVAGTLTFEVGQTVAYIDIPIIGDAETEEDEGFDVSLSNPVGATLGKSTTLTGTCTITDDEPEISLEGSEIDEGAGSTGGVLRFVVSLSDPAPQAVSVDYATADGSKDPAAAGTDYTASSGTLTIAAGKQQGYVHVPILDDSEAETDETISLTLSNPSGASFGKGDTLAATGTIKDDESADGGDGTISISAMSGYEGDMLYFSVSLSAPTSNEVTLSYLAASIKSKAKTGLAKPGSDFAQSSGTLTFAPGETVQVVAVQSNDDIIFEGTETFELVLANPKGAGFSGGVKSIKATGTLLDDERTISASAGELYEPVAADDGSAIADNLKLMRFAVSLSAPASDEVTLSYSTTKTKPPKGFKLGKGELTPYAAPGQDFAAGSGTLSFAPGDVTVYAYVEVFDDSRAEKDETFSLVLSKAVGAGFADNANSITVVGTILDNEPSVSV
jgi:hypothetical protein